MQELTVLDQAAKVSIFHEQAKRLAEAIVNDTPYQAHGGPPPKRSS